jgi:hypothetical protein
LQEQGHQISQRRVYNLLRASGYTRQANRKRDEGASHPDRNAQFDYIYQKVRSFLARTQPVISVDAKKKENLGNFKNPGQDYPPTGKAPQGRAMIFPDQARGKAIPYGGYDLAKDQGWVSVGISHDTAEFAVATLAPGGSKWGSPYPNRLRSSIARQMVAAVTAVAGGGGKPNCNGWPMRFTSRSMSRISPRHEHVEQDRASHVQLHLHELAGSAPTRPGDRRQPHWEHENENRPNDHGPARRETR